MTNYFDAEDDLTFVDTLDAADYRAGRPSDGEEALEEALDALSEKHLSLSYSPGRDIHRLEYFLGARPAHWTDRDERRTRALLKVSVLKCEAWLALVPEECWDPTKAKAQQAQIASLLPAVKAVL